MDSTKQQIYTLMEKFRDNPSNSNKYYHQMVALFEEQQSYYGSVIEQAIGEDIELGSPSERETWLKNVGHNAEKLLIRSRAKQLLATPHEVQE